MKSITVFLDCVQRPGVVVCYAGCNKQVFSSKPWKKLV